MIPSQAHPHKYYCHSHSNYSTLSPLIIISLSTLQFENPEKQTMSSSVSATAGGDLREARLRSENEELTRKLQSSVRQSSILEKETGELRLQVLERDHALEEARGEREGLRVRAERAEKEVMILKKQVGQMGREGEEREREMGKVREEAERVRRENGVLAAEMRRKPELVEALEREVMGLNKQLCQVSRERGELRKEVERVRREKGVVEGRLRDKKQEVGIVMLAATGRYRALEARVVSLERDLMVILARQGRDQGQAPVAGGINIIAAYASI